VSRAPTDALRYLGALATLVVGAVHLQQYGDFISDVPTIGVLFLLNGLGAGVLAILLATRRAPLGALGGIALSAGALVSVLISMTDGGLFDYTEPALRSAVVIAIVAEAAAVVLLLAYLASQRRQTPERLDWTERPRAIG
jgi:nitrate/nitrite transporter NarK